VVTGPSVDAVEGVSTPRDVPATGVVGEDGAYTFGGFITIGGTGKSITPSDVWSV